MFIRNKEDRIHALPGGVVLKPGVNEVEEAAWKRALRGGSAEGAKASTPKALKALLDKKLIEVVGSADATGTPVAGSNTPPPTSLADMKADEAEALVSMTYDRDLLSKWRSSEKRSGVLKAIDTQLKALAAEDKA
jgi:hypothetical protein